MIDTNARAHISYILTRAIYEVDINASVIEGDMMRVQLIRFCHVLLLNLSVYFNDHSELIGSIHMQVADLEPAVKAFLTYIIKFCILNAGLCLFCFWKDVHEEK